MYLFGGWVVGPQRVKKIQPTAQPCPGETEKSPEGKSGRGIADLLQCSCWFGGRKEEARERQLGLQRRQWRCVQGGQRGRQAIEHRVI